MRDPLTELAIRHGTDKFGWHDYTPHYHRLLEHRRHQPLRLLEVGVGGYRDPHRGGASLATWRDYLPHATITGLDIQRKNLPLGPRVAIVEASQVDADALADVIRSRGPFDVIIDDGSHQNAHVIETHRLLWPTLAPGGLYIAEDVQTAFFPRFGGSADLAAPNSVGHFRALARDLPPDVAGVSRMHNIVALHKAGGRRGLDDSTAAAFLGHSGPLAGIGHDLPDTVIGRPVRPAGDMAADGLVLHAAGVDLDAALSSLGHGGVLVLLGAPDAALADRLDRLWVDIDHVEKRHSWPGAEVDPLAAEVLVLERWPDGIVVVKGRNDYPSNFAFDPDHPLAAAALRRMAEVLAEDAEEEGLVQYASLVARFQGREAAAPWIARLAARGATSRSYYEIAGNVALGLRDNAQADRLFTDAAARYPGELLFIEGLVTARLRLGRLDEAERVAVEALAAHDRSGSLHKLLMQIYAAKGAGEASIAHARRARALTPGASHRGRMAELELGLTLAEHGDAAEARQRLTSVVDLPRAQRALTALDRRSA